MSYQGLFIPRHPTKYVGDAAKIVYRSSWERRFFAYCDETPGILRWASEEFCIPYVSPMDNRVHRYFPDVWLEAQTVTGHKAFLIEIKPKSQTEIRAVKRKTKRFLREAAAVAVNHAKWNAAKKLCESKDWTFLVLTEDHLFSKFK
jgi:hypothetical protein